MRIAIMQPGYLPWLGFFELMFNADLFVFLDDVQYTTRDWRNRNRIRTHQGWQWLTVPVLNNGKKGQMIKDVQINNTVDWRKKHLKALIINYRKAKFFGNYFSDIEKIFCKDRTNLCNFISELILYLKEKLGIATPCIRSSEFNIKSTKSKRIVEICKVLTANELYDSKAAADFLDLSLFEKEHIKVGFQDYKHPIYKQVYKPFVPYMSVIDLLFNCGEESLEIITGG